MQSQESGILKNAGGEHPDVEIDEADGDEAGPGEEHVAFVEKSNETPGRVPRRAERRTRKTIEFAADDVAQGVAGKSVRGEKDDVDEHDQGAEAHTEFAVEVEGFDCVVPKEAQEEDGQIQEVAVNILEDEGERSLAMVIAFAGFADGASRRIEKEGAVIGLALVVAGRAKAERRAEKEKRRRNLHPGK